MRVTLMRRAAQAVQSATQGASTARTLTSYALLAVPAVTFTLGTWQVARKFQKEELIEKMQAKLAMEARPLPLSPSDVRNMEYERVRIEGEFLHDQEMQVRPRTRSREAFAGMSDLPESGAHVVTPFRRADNGDIILVNRGFVPDSHRAPEKRPAGQVEGKQTIEGIVRFGEKSGTFTPNNDPEANEWRWLDLFAMARRVDGQPVLIDAVVESTPEGGLPAGGQTRIVIRNEHMQYIITWYALTAATLAMWFVLRRSSPAKQVRRLPPTPVARA